MMADLHEGVVAFGDLSPGRESIMLGRIQVGEITPVHGAGRSRYQTCFRLDLPGMSSRAWHPARDTAEARRQALARINDWMEAAGVRPIGRA